MRGTSPVFPPLRTRAANAIIGIVFRDTGMKRSWPWWKDATTPEGAYVRYGFRPDV